ncbi:MAG: DUF5110 domain-containing protein [Gemmatimonadota bacterium]
MCNCPGSGAGAARAELALGRSLDFQNGEAAWTNLSWDDAAQVLTIEPGEGSPVARRFSVQIMGERLERTVDYTGRRVQVTFD